MAGNAGRPVRYRGRPVATHPGETLAQSLTRRGKRILRRSVRYHRPRGPFCGVGYCTGCLVRVNGQPNVRACRYEPRPGDIVETENAWPSPELDALGLLDRISPQGFDSHRSFTRPWWAAPLYYRVLRRMTGFGRLGDTEGPRPIPPATSLDTDTVVIGAGTSGSEVARRLGAAGHPTIILDRDRRPASAPGVTIIDRCTAIFLLPPSGPADRPFRLLATLDDGRGLSVRARTVVAAPGGYDASLLFPGNDRPGVHTAEGAVSVAPSPAEPPFRRAILIGGGARAAELLDRWGTFVEAVVAPGPVGPDVARRASELGVDIYPRTLVVRALGGSRVRGLRLAPRGGGEEFRVDCDGVVIAHRRLPNHQLFFQAGARMDWRAETGAYYPVLSDGLSTTVPGLFAVGEAAGFVGPAAAESARLAADAILGEAPPAELPARVGEAGANELEGYYRELLGRPGPRAKAVACPCEDVLLSELAEASRRGYRGIEVVKRYTSLGAGLCQGRYCLPDALLLLSIWEGRPPPEVGYIRQRPPVVPASLTVLAGFAEPTVGEAP
jgi:sarcosine oxidase subunit alpha